MIKYYSVDRLSNLIKIDSEADALEGIEYITSNIDWIYRIPEDGVLVYNNSTEEVKAGDIVFKMYGIEDKYSTHRELIVIKDEKLIDYYSRLYQHLASKKSQQERNDDCCCEKCKSIQA